MGAIVSYNFKDFKNQVFNYKRLGNKKILVNK